MKKLVKGNEAVVLGSLAAGCDAYFGYPITPASEIAQLTSEYYLKLGKIFIQAECEVASINMLMGGSSAGMRVMTSSSGPGISLMQEGLSFFSGGELPAVIVDIMRVGPGIGNIGPEQSDYFQIVKGGGHGSYHLIVLAPNSASEMYQMTIKAFELADQYRMPVVLLADATLGQMMEAIDLVELPLKQSDKKWKLDPTPATNQNVITTIYLESADMERHINHLKEKFEQVERNEADAETWQTDDAEIVLTGYGIISRILHTVVDRLRQEGIKAGLLRPKTLWPFPKTVFEKVWRRQTTENGKESNGSHSNNPRFLVVELSTGQFIEDVRLSIPNAQIDFYGRVGGDLPSEDEIIQKVRELMNSF